MPVDDVACLVGNDNPAVIRRRFGPQVDRTPERKGRDPHRERRHAPTTGRNHHGTLPQAPHGGRLTQHDAGQPKRTGQPKEHDHRFERRETPGSRRLRDPCLHRCKPDGHRRRNRWHRQSGQHRNTQPRDDARRQGQQQQIAAAPPERHAPVQQQSVGAEQHAAAHDDFQPFDQQLLHDFDFLALRTISRISSCSAAEIFSWREKNDTSCTSEPSK